MMAKKYRVIEPDGTTCPRCDSVAETRVHAAITEKQLKQPFYYKRWYVCLNEHCKTNIFMLDDWKVKNKNGAALELEAKNDFAEQMSFLKSI
jgi:hypothetical protein